MTGLDLLCAAAGVALLLLARWAMHRRPSKLALEHRDSQNARGEARPGTLDVVEPSVNREPARGKLDHHGREVRGSRRACQATQEVRSNRRAKPREGCARRGGDG